MPAPPSTRVVLYCSVDEVFAKPIIADLQRRTGLRIDALFDTEATKTAGLAVRIRAERNRPRGDVFWSSALLQTLLLAREGLVQPYQSPAAKDIPPTFKDARGMWTGMGVREHVLLYYSPVVHSARGDEESSANRPRSLQDLLQPRFKGKVGISNPQFGTSSDWAASLATRWGVPKTVAFFRALKRNGVRVEAGNSVVADKIARGELLAGLADTDDYEEQRRHGGHLRIAYREGIQVFVPVDGTLVPGTAALIKGAPHSEAARQLIDALLASRTQTLLAAQMPGVFTFYPHRDVKTKVDTNPVAFLQSSYLHDYARWPVAWDAIREPLAQILLTE